MTTANTGMSLGLAAVSMMFLGLTSAYVVSQGLGPVWKQVHLSPLIVFNTMVLLCSSYTMQRKWRKVTLTLGIVFLLGQIGVYQQLANEGFYLNSGRQASFYYVLTALHGLHILGGIVALAWAKNLAVMSLYWHFMGGLWLYLLLVIFL